MTSRVLPGGGGMAGAAMGIHRRGGAVLAAQIRRPLLADASELSRAVAVGKQADGALTLEPGAAGRAAKGEASSGLARALARLAWPAGHPGIKARVVSSIALLATSKGLSVASPMCFKHAVDNLANPGTIAASTSSTSLLALLSPESLLALYGCMRAGSSLAQEARSAIFARVTQRAGRVAAREAFAHALRLDAGFHSMQNAGSIQRSIDRGARGVQSALSAAVLSVTPTLLEGSLVAGVLASRCGAELAWLSAGTVALYGAFTIAVTRWRTSFRAEMNAKENECAAVVAEALSHHEAVKAFSCEHVESQRYDQKLAGNEIATLKTQRSLAILNFGQAAIFSSSLAAALLLCARGVHDGSLTVGDVAMVNSLLFQLSVPLAFLGTAYREARQSVVDMSHMLQLLEAKPSVTERQDALPLPQGPPSVKLSDVSFEYPAPAPSLADACNQINQDAAWNKNYGSKRDNNNKPSDAAENCEGNESTNWYRQRESVLSHVNLEVEPGESVAIVGPSGGGKSTVFKLLLRLHDPTSGCVQLNGIDARDLSTASLREASALVPQDAALFNDTLFNNIAYGYQDASEHEVQAAANDAALNEVIAKLPDGLHTHLGQSGARLSGGERQRVALARAFLRQPRLLLADEPTSALDPQTEAEVSQALFKLASGRTSIFIAHRLSTARMCDRIAVIADGMLREHGAHEELLAKDGYYAALWGKHRTDRTAAAAAHSSVAAAPAA